MGDVQMCATCGHNILRGDDFVCEIGHDVPCQWVAQSVPHASAVDRIAELEAEVERLTKERDDALAWAKNWETACEAKNKQLDEYDEKVAASEMVAIERGGCDAAMREMEIARHESARLAGERDAALARAEKAEKERDEAVRVRNNAIVEAASLAVFREAAEATMIQQEKEVSAANDRATAAEAREARLREAVRRYVAWSNGEEGDGDTLFDAMRVSVDLLQAFSADATTKEVPPCR